ncbi:hypothetical protein RirG_122620 [Rhizophagus irregularis DAOM 197198w]|uniref:Uncharacterized protein n=1 Tax=Rhizophagus irregularis (strain DAOM 197198w) TaxID=1432141 RepID=A0A015L2H7_RHIIW|nr:hypothetical protein RirG_122620 [Rhizophagus irregularis DAOM 197198w]
MSIINFGLQGVAIMRDIMSTELEDIFKKVDALEEIHAAAAKNEDLKNGLRDCILNIQQLLHSRTERLIILEIDKLLDACETTAEILSKKKDFKNTL